MLLWCESLIKHNSLPTKTPLTLFFELSDAKSLESKNKVLKSTKLTQSSLLHYG